MAKRLDAVYGNALFAAAKEENKLRSVYDEAKKVMVILKENSEIEKLLVHPGVGHDEKVLLVKNIFDGRCDDLITGVLIAATDKNHGDKLFRILRYFTHLVMKEYKIGKAFVTSAVPLDDSYKTKIMERLIETTGYESMEMQFTVDPEIIGGLIIRIGDRVFDDSVKTKLTELKKTLINA